MYGFTDSRRNSDCNYIYLFQLQQNGFVSSFLSILLRFCLLVYVLFRNQNILLFIIGLIVKVLFFSKNIIFTDTHCQSGYIFW